MFSQLLGGIGLFLLGMILMTDGLKALAGDALRRTLSRLTDGRWRALGSGALLTALVQSSSATTLATIGFVSAGLLPLTQAVLVNMGASLGTTSTGWIVSLLGLKLKIGAAAMPLIGAGALLRLLTRDRRAAMGLTLAGFGLIFIGIDALQHGMADLAARVDFSAVPGERLSGRLLLAAIGMAMSVLMQSSSAAVATTLAAFHSGAITHAQALPLIIGQTVGTTVTAGLAAIGGSIPAQRTALGHILFNAGSGALAFALLPLWLRLVDAALATAPGAGAAALAGFHTGFVAMGLLAFLPWTERLSRLLARALPERVPELTHHLDPTVAQVPALALDAARRTTGEIFGAAVAAAGPRWAGKPPGPADAEALARARGAAVELARFLGRVRVETDRERERSLHLGLLHAGDHLLEFIDACGETPRAVGDPALSAEIARAGEALRRLAGEIGEGRPDAKAMESRSRKLASFRRERRREILADTAAGTVGPESALQRLETVRWLDRLVFHAWRIAENMQGRMEEPAPPA